METNWKVPASKNGRRALWRLIRYMRPHAKMLTLAFTLLTLATTATVIAPILVKQFIDDYLTPHRFPAWPLIRLATSYLGLYILSVVLSYFQLISFQTIALRVVQQLRIDVFDKVQHLGLAFFDKTPTGALVSRITNDTESIKDLYVSVLSTFVQNIIFFIGVFVSMFYLNVQLAALCLVLVPVIYFVMWLYRRLSSRVFHLARHKLSQLNAKLNESLQGMYLIQAMRQEKRLRTEFGKTNQEYRDARVHNVNLNSLLLRPLMEVVYLSSLILVLSFFGFRSFHAHVEIGVVYVFVNYLERFFEPVNQMMMRLNMFQQAVVSAERVFEVLDESTMAPTREGNEDPKVTSGLIRFDDVTFSYDDRTPVLRNISFEARPGQTVALVGHTGSGKSSIVNLLMRFYPVHQGSITIDGAPLTAFSDDELRSKIGLVLQDPFLFVGDVNSNIRLGNPEIRDADIVEAARFVQAHGFIEHLPHGFEEQIGERGATFSGGQRQLLSFARTIVRNPRILVLDEATASIDTETEELIQEALEKMRKGRTTIAIAHRLSTIQDADLILVLHRGEIVERGTHQELLAAEGLYHKMYLLQQGASAKVSELPM